MNLKMYYKTVLYNGIENGFLQIVLDKCICEKKETCERRNGEIP